MKRPVRLPSGFAELLHVANAPARFDEALAIADQIAAADVALMPWPDHAAIFTDPPLRVAGPLKQLGYVVGWDNRCYPSPVDGCDYINVAARLPAESPQRREGWFDYVAIVHPVDQAARDQMAAQGYGNPFLHHVTWGIVPPERRTEDEFAYAATVVPYMVGIRASIAEALGEQPGTLILALPSEVVQDGRFSEAHGEWVRGCPHDEYRIEPMEGGGFLIQFFVLTGGRIEVALRVGTSQTFNPRSVDKISRDEISTRQER